MEQAQQADKVVDSDVRTYERYGWIILSASAVLGIFAAVTATLPPLSWFWNPLFESSYSIMGAWGVSWVGFNIFALVMIRVRYRRGERWAWFTLWMLPLMWLAQFALAPGLLYYLVLAIITTAGLVLPYRRFFSGPEDKGSLQS